MNAVIRPDHPPGEHTAIHWSSESMGDSASPFGASYIRVGRCYCGEETCGKCEGCGKYMWSDDMSHVIELCEGCAIAKEEAQMEAIEATYTAQDMHQALWGDPLTEAA